MPYTWLCLLFCIGSCVLFFEIIHGTRSGYAYAHFLNVGQGDSEFFVFPDGNSMLIDGGPWNGMLRGNIEKSQGKGMSRYIDILAITHPEEDHFGGILDIIDTYDFGVFIWNGREENISESFRELLGKVKEKNIPVVIFKNGSEIIGNEWSVRTLNPNEEYDKKPNEASLVFLVNSKGLDVLITGDIGKETEEKILENIHKKIDVLKVSHHGSKYSSSKTFLQSILPRFSVIEVGKNSFGHPAGETIQALREVGSEIFRTDEEGNITFESNGEKIRILR